MFKSNVVAVVLICAKECNNEIFFFQSSRLMEDNSDLSMNSFLFNDKKELDASSLIKLNLYLNSSDQSVKPYQIDYNVLLLSYSMWEGKSLEEFCEKQTLSYFLFNPQNDSAEAREAMYMDIREFLMGN